MAKRKNKYITHVLPRMIEIKGWIRNGAIDKDVAKKLGVAYSTFRDYVSKYPELEKAVMESKTVIDFEVEESLYKSANGYEYEEVKETFALVYDVNGEPILDENGNQKQKITERVVTKKHVQGNVSAQQFWLKNRMPEIYREKIENTVNGGLNINIDDDALMRMIKEAEHEAGE